MLVNEVPLEKLKQCMEKIAESFNPASSYDRDLMKEGLDYFRKGLVYNASVEDTVVTAIVEGAAKYQVEVHLDFIEISHCSCNRHVFCPHKLAVFFYLYSYFGSAGEFVNTWRLSSGHSSSSKDLHAPVDTVKMEQALPFDENSLEDWFVYFEKEYQTFLRNEGQDVYFSINQQELQLLKNIYHVYYPRLLHTAVPNNPNKALLFILHASLTTFYKIIDRLANSSFHHQSTAAINSNISDLVEEIFEIILDINIDAFNDEEVTLLQESISRFDKLLTINHRFPYERLFLYRAIWSNLLPYKSWIEYQEKAMEQRRHQEDRIDYLIALIHFRFMKNEDEQAFRLLQELDDENVILCTIWIRMLLDLSDWERVEPWLDIIVEKTGSFIHSSPYRTTKQDCVTYYLNALQEYAEGTSSYSLYNDALEAWLPYSFGVYSQQLLKQEKFRKWTELQIAVGASIEHINRDVLKEIEAKDRSCLLPLYHQLVITTIEEKNRGAYRQAVKYLRKLRTHYRSLKQLDVWEAFIIELSTKYKRLRAFQ